MNRYSKGDYVEFKYNGELKKGWIEQVVKLDNISSDMFVLKTKSGKTYYAADGITDDLFKIIRKLPILRDMSGRFACKEYSKEEEILYTNNPPFGSWGSLEQKTFAEAKRKIEKSVDAYKKKNDCSCFNCDECAEQMRAYYEKTGELKPSNVTKGPVKNSTGGGKTTETVTEDYMSTLEFGQMPYDSFGSRVKTEEKKPSERIEELFKYKMRENEFNAYSVCLEYAIKTYLDEQFEKGEK